MKTTEITGLNVQRTVEVVNALQQLLADFQVHYTNLRHLHWFVKGHSFFIMHEKYEELYDDAAEKIDEVAERIECVLLEAQGVAYRYVVDYERDSGYIHHIFDCEGI